MATKPRAPHRRTASGRRAPRGGRVVELTVTYQATDDGWYAVEVIGAEGVFSQGRTIEEAREMARDAIASILETAPHQFTGKKRPVPPGALTETLFVVLPG